MAKIRSKPGPPRPLVVVNGLVLNAAQAQAWRTANEDAGANESIRKRRGLAALSRLARELEDRISDAAVARGLEESVALERARGEKVEISKRQESRGRVRIRTRDGLETLERSGAIDSTQYKAGLLYRDLYEATDPERALRSHLESPDRCGRPGEAAAEAWAERRLRLARAIAAIESKVRLADRNGRAVRLLREVAGNARAVGALVAGGGSQAAAKRAVVIALEVCVTHFGLR